MSDAGQIERLTRKRVVQLSKVNTFVLESKLSKKNKDIMIGESSPKTEDRIVELMSTNPSISTEEIGNRIGITKRAVLKQVEKLKLKGIIERIGPAKGGYWKIIKENS